jgi:TIR domain
MEAADSFGVCGRCVWYRVAPAMADVFLSYAQEDRTRARQLADALRERGWDVWWDAHVYVGTSFRAEITRQLETAKCVVVLWSKASIKSAWVIDEAQDGMDRGVLVQALIEGARPPHGFRGIHWADLTSWSGDTHAEEFVKLSDGITRFAPVATPTPAATPRALPPDPPADTVIDSDVQPPEPEGWVRWLRLASDSLAQLANRRPLIVGGAGLASVIVAIIALSNPPTEQASQVAQVASPTPTISSPPSASPSTDASPGQKSGNDSAPRVNPPPNADAPVSPPRSPATTIATAGSKPATSESSPGSLPTVTRSSGTGSNGAVETRSSKTPSPETATVGAKPEGSRSSSPTTTGTSGLDLNKLFELPSPTTASPRPTISTTEGAKPPASDGSRSSSSTAASAPSSARAPATASTIEGAKPPASDGSGSSSPTAARKRGFWGRVFGTPSSTPSSATTQPSASSDSTGTLEKGDCPSFFDPTTVSFVGDDVSLDDYDKATLNDIATQWRKNAGSFIHVTVYDSNTDLFSPFPFRMSTAVQSYFQSQGIPRDRTRVDYKPLPPECNSLIRSSGWVKLEIGR